MSDVPRGPSSPDDHEPTGVAPGGAGSEEAIDEEAMVATEVLVAAEASRERTAGVGAFRRLYRGLTTFDFVGRRRTWFAASALIIVVGMSALGIRGLNLGIDFKGGSTWTVAAKTVTQAQVVSAVTADGISNPTVEILTDITTGLRTVQVEADLNALPSKQRDVISNRVIDTLARLAGHVNTDKVSSSFVGPTWGGEVTNKALEALIAFFVAVVAYISIRFEPKMALAAFLAMLHDLAVTVGIYAIFGFQVTPDTVVAVLTILGYSLYDTVVVFDRIRDNAKPFAASGRMTYSAMVNLSMNQTLARSINTSAVAILPVLSVLLVGAELLGATTLQDYGVALTVGLLSGAYSSIFIASPLLAVMKEREGKYKAIRARLASKGDRMVAMSAQDAARILSSGSASSTGSIPRGTGRQKPPPRPTARSTSPVAATAASSPTAATSASGASTAPSSPAAVSTRTPTTTLAQPSTPIIQPRARKQKKR
jgi:preprotein translocase subunit SecF